MKIGLLFAGQGAQYSGMGSSLYQESAAAKKIMDMAGDQVKDWCFQGTKEMLRETRITQPCIYAVTMAAYEAFLEAVSSMDERKQASMEMTGMAGFSMGEYAALTAAGVIDDIQKGMDIIVQRGILMNAAGLDAEGNPKGSMVAAFGNRDGILSCVEEAREDGILSAVNFNSPVQTVVAGDQEALERFKAKASELRIKAKQLSVSTAFHSPMMNPAAEALLSILEAAELREPKVKVYSNVTGKGLMEEFQGTVMLRNTPLQSEVREYIARRMAYQAKSPVYWQETIENMVTDGIEAVVEIGPGTTLSSLVKKISPELLIMNVEDMESMRKTMATLKAGLEEGSNGEEGMTQC